MGEDERNELMKKLGPMNLTIYDIPADGHCLFRAVAHQLSILNEMNELQEVYDYKMLRRLTSEYILDNKDSFVNYFEDAERSDGGVEAYCEKIRDTAEWGGEIELCALCLRLKHQIVVYGGADPFCVLSYGGMFKSEPPIQLTYHRHAYTLGEHYNSVVPSSAVTESDS